MNISAKKVYLEYLDNLGNPVEIIKSLEEVIDEWSSDGINSILNIREVLFTYQICDGTSFRITFTNGDKVTSTGYVSVGKIISGVTRGVGDTLINPSISLQTMTVKTRDKSGYNYYDKQNTYKEASYEVHIDNSFRNIAIRLFEEIDGKDCLFLPDISSSDYSINCFGCYSDFSIESQSSTYSSYSLTVEGQI